MNEQLTDRCLLVRELIEGVGDRVCGTCTELVYDPDGVSDHPDDLTEAHCERFVSSLEPGLDGPKCSHFRCLECLDAERLSNRLDALVESAK